jgi:hypothetical protein
MIARGANVKTVQAQLGHKTATMTLDQYGHLFPDDLDDVAEKMDDLVSGCPQKVPTKEAGQGENTPVASSPAHSMVQLADCSPTVSMSSRRWWWTPRLEQ